MRNCALVVLLAAVLTACGGVPSGSISAGEARARADAIAVQLAGGLPFERAEWIMSGGSCVRPWTDSDYTGQVRTGVRYRAPVEPSGQLPAIADAWRRAGHEVAQRPENVTTDIDRYRVTASPGPVVDPHSVRLYVVSSCVWPDGGTP